MRLSPDIDRGAEEFHIAQSDVVGPYTSMRQKLEKIGCMVLPHDFLGYGAREDFLRGLNLIRKSRQKIISKLP